MTTITIDDLAVHSGSPAKLKVEIGNHQHGTHTWTGGAHPEEFPPPENTKWETDVFFDEESNYIEFTSSVRNHNPDTNWVSVHISVNGEEIEDERLEKEVQENELVEFVITLNLLNDED